MKRSFILMAAMLGVAPVVNTHAFQCYITVMKGNCWKNFNVKIDVIDDETQQHVVPTIDLNKETMWQRKPFECQPRQAFNYLASYTPPIWQDNQGKQYPSKRIWYMPEKIKPKVGAWEIPLCFPTDFSSVPLPPNADDLCTCDKVRQSIPPLPPVEMDKPQPNP